jgi:hypothetical protein
MSRLRRLYQSPFSRLEWVLLIASILYAFGKVIEEGGLGGALIGLGLLIGAASFRFRMLLVELPVALVLILNGYLILHADDLVTLFQ